MEPTIHGIGAMPKRLEDDRLIRGKGCYLADLVFPNAAHAIFLRSPHAHAVIRSIDTSEAEGAPGVLAVLTAADAARDGLKEMMPFVTVNEHTGDDYATAAQPLLAEGRVRHVGEAVALVVAEAKTAGLDAAERIAVDYEILPAVSTAAAARASTAPQLSETVPGNVCLDWTTGDAPAVAAAFSHAVHTVEIDIRNHRVASNAMEPRGMVASYSSGTGRYELEISTQNVHVMRDRIAEMLGVGQQDVRVTAPDVGGGFGSRNFTYTEYALLAWAARRTGRSVRWIGDRSEGMATDHPARDQTARAALALDAEGGFLALRIESWANLGAYTVGSSCAVQTGQYRALPGGAYAIPAVELRIGAALTNTTPTGVIRGPGFGEMVNAVERLIDRAAETTGIDRFELRRRNLVPGDAMPWTSPTDTVVDSGDFPARYAAALDKADAASFAARRSKSEAEGRRRGLGVAYHIKGTGGSPDESVELAFDGDNLVLTTGTQTIGQGHETTFRQMVSEKLGLPFDRIAYRQADTDLIHRGGGHGSSRATYMGGTCIHFAAMAIIDKGTRVAADALEAAASDIEFAEGAFHIRGTDRNIDLLSVARLAREKGDPLDTLYDHTRTAMTYPNGCHVAEVEVDIDTGRVTLLRYTAVDDYGVLVNPMVASGQVHGAIAQGIGQALLEEVRFNPDDGQLISGSFMDYAMPRADDLPSFDIAFESEPCTTNPLGVKGCGEAGAIAGYPAITNAVLDALAPLGVTEFDGPATPYRIWKAIRDAAGEGGVSGR